MKNYTENIGKPITSITTDERRKRMHFSDNQIIKLRKQTSQITKEIGRLTTNGKLTPKLRKNRKWMTSEIKNKITKQRLHIPIEQINLHGIRLHFCFQSATF